MSGGRRRARLLAWMWTSPADGPGREDETGGVAVHGPAGGRGSGIYARGGGLRPAIGSSGRGLEVCPRRRWRAGRRPRLVVALLGLLLLAGCGIPERLARVGQVPELEPVRDPREEVAYRPVRMPMPRPRQEIEAGPASLWRAGARGFFRDQRARRVGDIVTVEITIADRAKIQNRTVRDRKNGDSMGLAGLFGVQQRLARVLPGSPDPARLVALDSAAKHQGSGAIDRAETIRLAVAAVVTQVLPNGNLVIRGRQEVRVNFEVREVVVAGVVRPEDIRPDNTIPSDRIAELRVGYGGRGQITDVQQPRWGAQVLDILLPY